jgi:hypothetical protein
VPTAAGPAMGTPRASLRRPILQDGRARESLIPGSMTRDRAAAPAGNSCGRAKRGRQQGRPRSRSPAALLPLTPPAGSRDHATPVTPYTSAPLLNAGLPPDRRDRRHCGHGARSLDPTLLTPCRHSALRFSALHNYFRTATDQMSGAVSVERLTYGSGARGGEIPPRESTAVHSTTVISTASRQFHSVPKRSIRLYGATCKTAIAR